jgi:hypothetical protein
VIGLGAVVRVMVSTRPVDFRKGAEGLAALVREIESYFGRKRLKKRTCR